MNKRYLVIVPLAVIIIGLVISVALCVLKKEKDVMDSKTSFKKKHFPVITLSNGVIEADVFLTDKENGYYRDSRFDWSGMVDQVRFKGHTFFHDHNMKVYQPSFGRGIAEEFSMGISDLPGPLGYQNAQAGQGFLKIGVGVLEKDSNDEIYSFAKSYKILDSGNWQIRHGQDWVEFVHVIKDFNSWGYRYKKRVSLIEGRAELLIERLLENTGTKTIDTVHYGHNFVIIDNAPVGPDYNLSFPFNAKVSGGGLRDYITLQDTKVVFSDIVPEGEKIWAALEGFKQTDSDNSFVIENKNSGAGLHIEGDLQMKYFQVYLERTMLCPEPFVMLAVNPDETVSWQTKYSFYELSK